MSEKQVLFVHGGGDDGYHADAVMASSLRRELGERYNVRYPEMPDEESPDFGWMNEISKEVAAISDEVLLVGHSLGASMLLKCLSEREIDARIRGIFLMATPFWKATRIGRRA